MSENKHARDALIEAYRYATDGEEAKKAARLHQEGGEDYVNLYKNPHVRGCFNQLQTLISSEEAGVQGWDDVFVIADSVVQNFLHADLKPLEAAVAEYMKNVVLTAKQKHPIYVNPPPFE